MDEYSLQSKAPLLNETSQASFSLARFIFCFSLFFLTLNLYVFFVSNISFPAICVATGIAFSIAMADLLRSKVKYFIWLPLFAFSFLVLGFITAEQGGYDMIAYGLIQGGVILVMYFIVLGLYIGVCKYFASKTKYFSVAVLTVALILVGMNIFDTNTSKAILDTQSLLSLNSDIQQEAIDNLQRNDLNTFFNLGWKGSNLGDLLETIGCNKFYSFKRKDHCVYYSRSYFINKLKVRRLKYVAEEIKQNPSIVSANSPRIPICDRLPAGDEGQAQCYSAFAANTEQCNLATEYELCLLQLALKNQDVKICALTKDKNQCLMQIGKQYLRIDICRQIGQSDYRSWCIQYYIENTRDNSPCSEIKDDRQRKELIRDDLCTQYFK